MAIADVVELLTGPDMHEVVDLVAHRDGERVVVTSATGRIALDPNGVVIESSGINPFADERQYPNAAESITQIFDADCVPDLVISHHPKHKKYEIGDHGSLQQVHARAPFIAAGAGIRAEGRVDRSLRMIDVAPTIAALLGAEMVDPDGTPDDRLLDGNEAGSVVAFLLDGTNLDTLYRTIDSGRAPTMAGLLERGTGYLDGVLSSFPSVTLPNHMTIGTGRHPGHTGVPSNQWHDRRSGQSHDLLDQSVIVSTLQHLADDVDTIHHAVHRARPGAFTACTFEYCDAGADWSSFAEVREGRRTHLPIRSRGNRHINPMHADTDWYRTMSKIDANSINDAITLIDDGADPDFLFVNLSLTDESGHHAGPFAETTVDAIAETDTRLGEVLDHIAATGRLDDAAVVVLADHGMGECDPTNTVVVSEHLATHGIEAIVTEEMFVYLT